MLRNRRGIFGFGAMVVTALVAVVACGGDDPTQTPEQLSSVDAESQFLARLATIAGASSDAELEIRNQLVEGPQARDDTLARIVEIGLDGAARRSLPPPKDSSPRSVSRKITRAILNGFGRPVSP